MRPLMNWEAFCVSMYTGQAKRYKRGMNFGLSYDEEWVIRPNRPVSGKKSPSERVLWKSCDVVFFRCCSRCFRFFSTSIREENVRTLRASGPETASAASRASGWRVVWESFLDIASTGEASGL